MQQGLEMKQSLNMMDKTRNQGKFSLHAYPQFHLLEFYLAFCYIL